MSENNENYIPDLEKQTNKDKEQDKNKKENNNSQKETNNSKTDISQLENLEYKLLREDYPIYDLSFKIILIGESGK